MISLAKLPGSGAELVPVVVNFGSGIQTCHFAGRGEEVIATLPMWAGRRNPRGVIEAVQAATWMKVRQALAALRTPAGTAGTGGVIFYRLLQTGAD